MMLSRGAPWRRATRLRQKRSTARSSRRGDAPATCGVMTAFAIDQSGWPGQLAAGSAQTDNAHRSVGQLPTVAPDAPAIIPGGLADRACDTSRYCQEERERLLGKVWSDVAFLTGEDDRAVDEILKQEA